MARPWWLLLVMACGPGPDEDGDGVGAGEDCDDGAAEVFPGAAERCDGIDNDCDGATDDEDDGLAPGVPSFFADGDGDGAGGASLGQWCDRPAGSVRAGGDCDDALEAVKPGAAELCDGVDNDCDGLTDDQDDVLDPASTPRWFRDVDGDGYGSAADLISACAQPEGYVADATDCDDTPEGADRNPGAPEICDGKDNNCDVATGLLVDDADPLVDLSTTRFWYVDGDRDGQGDVLSATQSCTPPPGTVDDGRDCNDRDPNNYVGGTEVCDGRDNDCDGLVDATDWWDPAWPYRVLVRLDAPPHDIEGPPLAVDVDFDAGLAMLGDASGVDLDSVRVVLQDCTAGYVELPSDRVDNAIRLFDKRSMFSQGGDGEAMLAFRYDTDGDYTTPDVFAAGTSATVGIYFGSTGNTPGLPAPTYPSAMTAAVAGAFGSRTLTIDTGVSVSVLDEAQGGLVSAFGLRGGPSEIGAQTANVFGNGVFFAQAGGGGVGAGWASAVSGAGAGLVTVHAGDVLTLGRATGTASNPFGGYSYTYYFAQFVGRPEMYVKVVYQLDRDSHLGPQGTFWTAAVRPYQVDNVDLVGGGSSGSKDDPGFRWVHGAYPGSDAGVFAGWRLEAEAIGSPFFQPDGRYLALTGQDHTRLPVGNEVDLPSGSVIVNGSVMMVYPHAGGQGAVLDEVLGLLDGVSTTVMPAQRRPP